MKPYLSFAMFLEQESNGQPDAARTRQSRCMKSSLMRATVPASVGFQLNDFQKDHSIPAESADKMNRKFIRAE
ncbi:MAG: hypothetical protein JOZ26_14380 [Hyphomicrobiales bacterium]|nr:hypothetical protein [Hyphomicrobiales bacterium]MBV8421193.1 hypothetical protein [Hyphomicrobiales bacterium]